MKITINKDSQVPVRDQLVEQIGLQIASGILKEKDKLPSIRALAQRLGIHHSTVTSAYNHLADVGLLDVRQGSGVRVASTNAARGAVINSRSVDSLLRAFLSQAAENGFSRGDLRERFKQIIDKKPVKRLLVIDRNKDFHPLLIAELQPHFSLPVQPVTHEELDKKVALLEDSLVVTSLYHVFPLQDMPIDPTRLVVCNIEPGREQMDAIVALPEGSIVVLVSVSETLLRMARNVAAALRGEEVAIRSVLFNDKEELKYMMQYAKVVIADGPSYEATKKLAGKVPVHGFHLYSPATIEVIKDRLEKWG
ncbi:MAG TPA: GntR family transcriptional regulator [Candidatus Obscuribacterales bacterium]